MNLKKLEINGFKSFVNGLELNFDGGVTAILGPNGCGKTNIVDAIRWVLGEQKTRLLRNTKMENVIFNGTKLRKPLGMAEVHMTLSNEDHSLGTDYSDVSIGRRLYRSGVSEYFLNGEPARLKDIRNLLVDTGLGNNTYSIIEREMVDSVISERDQDKRALLEEAAGVMRYRIQREEALRKIKHTETDLTRLVDILSELEKELRSLRYQMGKARRYARLKEQVDSLESVLIKRSMYELLVKVDAVNEEKAHHEGITLADENEITLREDRLQAAKIDASDQERKLQALQEERYRLSQSLQQQEERIAILNERITTGHNRIVEDKEEIERATAKLATLEEEQEGHRARIEDREASLQAHERDLQERTEALKEAGAHLDRLKAELRDHKQLVLDLVREKERERGLREHLQNRLDELVEKRGGIESEKARLESRERDVLDAVRRDEESLKAQRQAITDSKHRLDENSRKSERVVELLGQVEDHASRTHIERNRLNEKKEYLERIKEEHSRRSGSVLGQNGRFKGVLADRIRIDRPYRRCFEACLSPVLSAVLAESKRDAVESLGSIRNAGNGRFQMLYPSGEAGNGNGNGNGALPATTEGILGRALDFIGGDADIVSYLTPHLSNVAVARSVDDAVMVLDRHPNSRVATLDGVFFDGPGRIVVSSSDDIEMTLLEYDAKIDELNTRSHQAHAREGTLQTRKANLTEAKGRFTARAQELRLQLTQTEAETERVVGRQRQNEIELAKIREKLMGLRTMLREDDSAAEELRGRLSATHGEGDPPSAMSDDDLAALEQRVVDMERRKEALAEEASKARLEVATVSGEIAAAKEKQNTLLAMSGELNELVRARSQDAARCRSEIDRAETEIGDSRGAIAELHGRVDAIESELEGAKEQYEAAKTHMDTIEVELRDLKKRREEKRENLQRCNLELATLETRITTLIEKGRENFNHDLEPYIRRRELFDPSEWEQLDTANLGDLREQLDKFGPVNMLALEEFNEKKERFDFLTKQREDLEEAKDALVQAIRRINREARKRLAETFEQVRQNFKETFMTLFDGGEADLYFTDSDDPLEANIKIVASPKGKKLHDIASLSGGERALVALSLLFGIYLVKPSPFCVFDEVDAPLDDANIGRFVRLLKSFTDRTRFIVITHNKKTMEAADHLYGVTMQEPGVSRTISVHIGEVDRFQNKATARGSARVTEPEEVTVQT